MTHEDEIYYVTPDSPTRPQIEDAIADARAASGFVGFGFDRATAGLEVEDGTELTITALERIADAVEFVVVDAFDGEGYAVGFRVAS